MYMCVKFLSRDLNPMPLSLTSYKHLYYGVTIAQRIRGGHQIFLSLNYVSTNKTKFY